MRPLEIDSLLKSANELDRVKCADLLTKYLELNEKDIKSWYDLACCYDFQGEERKAESCYEKVHASGLSALPLTDQKGFYVGYGSTLRNNGKHDRSQNVLREGVNNFPDYIPLQAFLGLSLFSAEEYREASLVLLRMALKLPPSVLDGYDRALAHYVQ